MLEIRLYLLQRLSALVMAPLVIGHLAVMIYAIQGGLSAAEILGRTQGSFAWATFYGTFVIAVSVHAAIGLRVIAHEWLGLGARALSVLTWIAFLVLVWMGVRAVWAVTAPGGVA